MTGWGSRSDRRPRRPFHHQNINITPNKWSASLPCLYKPVLGLVLLSSSCFPEMACHLWHYQLHYSMYHDLTAVKLLQNHGWAERPPNPPLAGPLHVA